MLSGLVVRLFDLIPQCRDIRGGEGVIPSGHPLDEASMVTEALVPEAMGFPLHS